MSPASERNAVRDALAEHSCWRRLRSAPVASVMILLGAAVCGNAAGKPKAAVLELRVAIGGVPADFGLAGARMLATALEATGRYELIDSDKVEAEVRERGLSPPFAVGHLQLLADVLGADLLLHGSIRGLTYDADAGAASVILAIEVVEGRSGRLKQRAEASGKRSAQTGIAASRQETLVGALAAAVESIVESLTGQRVTAALQVVSEQGSVADWPLGPALLPPTEVAVDIPKTGEPRADLTARSAEPEQPTVAVVPVTGPEPSPQTAPSPTPAITVEPEAVVEPLPEGLTERQVPLVQAKVLAKLSPDRALITLGKDAIVEPKMELEVYRVRYSRQTEKATKSRIGKLRVVKINPTDAEARILEGADLIHTGDLACYYGP